MIQFRILVISFALAFLTAPLLHAQAISTASKSQDISVFGGFVYENPDFGYTVTHNTGSTFGFDITRYLSRYIVPSLEARITIASGPSIFERTVVAGGRFETAYGRYHPYADFLVGGGVIRFEPNTAINSDRSTVYSYGGGVDIGLVHRVALKLDFQETHWNLGHVRGVSEPFTPYIVTIGASYRLPFRNHNRQQDIR